MPTRTPQQKTIQQVSELNAPLRPRRSHKKTFVVVLIILLLAGVAYYFFAKYRELKNNHDTDSDAEVAELVDAVGALMVLPEGETPTIATVSDPELLKGQPFFEKAKQGDKVLIYTVAGKVILYDPDIKKILEVAPIAAGGTGASQEQ